MCPKVHTARDARWWFIVFDELLYKEMHKSKGEPTSRGINCTYRTKELLFRDFVGCCFAAFCAAKLVICE